MKPDFIHRVVSQPKLTAIERYRIGSLLDFYLQTYLINLAMK